MSTANQFVGLAVDPQALGSTKDILGASPAYATPTLYIPVISANVSPGYSNLSRNNEVRNQRGQVPGVAFRAMPTMTFTCRLYPTLAAFLWHKALGGAIAGTGTAPAAITSKISVSSTALIAMQAIVVRGTQTDRLTGLWIDTIELSVPANDDPTMTVTCRALWHKHSTTSSPPTPTLLDEQPYSTVTLATKIGSTPTAISCVGDMSLTFNNNLVTDDKVVFCKNENIEVNTVSGRYQRRQYPGKHKLGDNTITGKLGFGTERTDIEDRLRVAQADKLVFELTGDPITPATTPAADELMRITLPMSQFTGGGASEMNEERDPDSDYEFEGFIDPAGGTAAFVEFVRKVVLS